MSELNEINYDIFILETNTRMILEEDVKKEFGFFIQEYVKEHYLEGCKPGFIKPVPLPNNKHILFINTLTKDKNLIFETFFKCLSFAKIINAKHVVFLITNHFSILHSVIHWWDNISYLDYNFCIEIIYNKKRDIKKCNKIKYSFETGYIQKIYFKTHEYIKKLHSDNLLVRNENYPIINLNKEDMEIINFYNEINFDFVD